VCYRRGDLASRARELDGTGRRPGLGECALFGKRGRSLVRRGGHSRQRSGHKPAKPVLELEPEEFSEVLELNVEGVFHCAKAYRELMVSAGRGKIINMASIFGLVAMERQAAYASSKGTVVQLTKVLALKFAPHNVQVNALAPAYFTTPPVR
jgi:NAD(P)-dependent dehydrogenase (short-subunit alcohol dehydrogenase family)